MSLCRTLTSKVPLLHPWCDLTSKIALCRTYALKSDLKIKWIRPVKIPSYKAVKTGDLTPYQEQDPKQPQFVYQKSQELATADETVKKLFSLEYAPRNKTTQLYLIDMLEKVRRHPYDIGSQELLIAKWTGVIRVFQEIMERFPRNKRLKVRLQELIDKRKKRLNYMRTWDYKKYEWLLEVLDLIHKPHPPKYHWITRKESLRKLTDKYCDEIRNDRLTAFREALKAQQPMFLEEKIRALEFIRDEQKACNAQVTISDEEIAGVKKQLEDLLDERKEQKEKDD